MQHIYRRIMGLYKGDCERLRILCRERLLSPSRSKETEENLRCRLLNHLPLFLEHSEHRPSIKKRAKAEKDQLILDEYDLRFYKECSTAYPFLTPEKVDVYYEEELRCIIPEDIKELFNQSVECQRCVTISPAIPTKTYPMHQIDGELLDAIVKAVQGLKEKMVESTQSNTTK